MEYLFEIERLKKENNELNNDLYFLADLLLIKFRPTNFCLTSKEQQKIKAIYKKTFTEKNNLE